MSVTAQEEEQPMDDEDEFADDGGKEQYSSEYTDYGTELVLAERENNVDLQAEIKQKIAAKLIQYRDLSVHEYGKLSISSSCPS